MLYHLYFLSALIWIIPWSRTDSMNRYQRVFIRLAYKTWSRERQWLSHTGEDKNPVASQSMKLGDSVVPTWLCRSGGFLERCRSSTYGRTLRNLVLISVKDCSSDGMGCHTCESETKQAESRGPVCLVLLFGWNQEVPCRHRAGLPASDNLVKKIPHRSTQHLGFLFILDLVKLATKISCYTLRNQNTLQYICSVFLYPSILVWSLFC